jgi:hypothetical protein
MPPTIDASDVPNVVSYSMRKKLEGISSIELHVFVWSGLVVHAAHPLVHAATNLRQVIMGVVKVTMYIIMYITMYVKMYVMMYFTMYVEVTPR